MKGEPTGFLRGRLRTHVIHRFPKEKEIFRPIIILLCVCETFIDKIYSIILSVQTEILLF